MSVSLVVVEAVSPPGTRPRRRGRRRASVGAAARAFRADFPKARSVSAGGSGADAADGSARAAQAARAQEQFGRGLLGAGVALLAAVTAATALRRLSRLRKAAELGRRTDFSVSVATLSAAASQPAGPAPTPLERLSYQVQRLLCSSLLVRLVALALLNLLLVLLGGVAYWLAATGDAATQGTIFHSLFKAYTLQGGVAGLFDAEHSLRRLVVANALALSSVFTFSLLVGLLASATTDFLERWRQGNVRTVERGHTLILNFNRRLAPPLLRQIAVASNEVLGSAGAAHTVLLSSSPKAEVERALAGVQLDESFVVREGRPWSVADLESLASVSHASRVIVLEDDVGFGRNEAESTEEFEAAALMAASVLSCGEALKRRQHGGRCSVVVQRVSSMVSLAARRLAQTQIPAVTVVSDVEREIARVLARATVTPGLASVYSQLLLQTPDTVEFYILRVPSYLVGHTFGEAVCAFEGADVVGYGTFAPIELGPVTGDDRSAGGSGTLYGLDAQSPGGAQPRVRLGPGAHDTHVLLESDTLCVVSGSAQLRRLEVEVENPELGVGMTLETAAMALPTHVSQSVQPVQVVVLGWSSSMGRTFLRALHSMLPEGSSVTVITNAPAAVEAVNLLLSSEESASAHTNGDQQRVTLAVTPASKVDVRALKRGGAVTASCVVVLSDDAPPPMGSGSDKHGGAARNGDAELVACLLLLEELSAVHLRAADEVGAKEHALSKVPKRAPRVLGLAQDPGTIDLARQFKTPQAPSSEGEDGGQGADQQNDDTPLPWVELVLPHELQAGSLWQVASEPQLGQLLSRDLLRPYGPEVVISDIKRFLDVCDGGADEGRAVTYLELVQRARLFGYAAFGVQPAGCQPRLVPSKTMTRVYRPGDKLVCIGLGRGSETVAARQLWRMVREIAQGGLPQALGEKLTEHEAGNALRGMLHPRQYYPGDPLKWRRGDETSALFITRGDVTVAGERRRAPTLVTMDQMSMANDSTAATECEGFSISADALQAILMLDPTLLDKARAGNPEPYNV